MIHYRFILKMYMLIWISILFVFLFILYSCIVSLYPFVDFDINDHIIGFVILSVLSGLSFGMVVRVSDELRGET